MSLTAERVKMNLEQEIAEAQALGYVPLTDEELGRKLTRWVTCPPASGIGATS